MSRMSSMMMRSYTERRRRSEFLVSIAFQSYFSAEFHKKFVPFSPLNFHSSRFVHVVVEGIKYLFHSKFSTHPFASVIQWIFLNLLTFFPPLISFERIIISLKAFCLRNLIEREQQRCMEWTLQIRWNAEAWSCWRSQQQTDYLPNKKWIVIENWRKNNNFHKIHPTSWTIELSILSSISSTQNSKNSLLQINRAYFQLC